MPQDGSINLEDAAKTATGPSWMSSEIAKSRDIQKKKESAVAPVVQEMKQNVDQNRMAAAKAYTGVEPLDVKPWTQKEAERDPLQVFGSMGSVFGILASAFTHTPMVNALNASAAAMTAIKANDHEAYKTAFEAWKENTNLAMERHKVQREAYLDARDKIKTDVEVGNAMMSAYNAMYGDQQNQVLFESGLHEHMDNVQTSRQNAALRLLEVQPQLERWGVQRGILMSNPDVKAVMDKKKNGQPVTPEESAKAAAAYQEIMSPFGAASSFSREEAKAVEDLVRQGVPRDQAIQKVKGGENKQIQTQLISLDAAAAQIDDLTNNLDRLEKESALGVTGLKGWGSRTLEFLSTLGGQDAGTPAHEFMSSLETIKLELPKLITGTSRSAVDERLRIERILNGLGPGSTPAIVKKQLSVVRSLIQDRQRRLSSGPESGTPGDADVRALSDEELKKRLGLP